MFPLSQKDALPGPASQSFSAIMQNNFRGLNIQSQSVEVSQRMRAPPPLFSQNAGPGPANGEDAPQLCSQFASQAYYEQMGTPDFITPVDQFQLEYEPGNKEARHQRSPARLSPNRIKRARILGNPTDTSQDQQQDHNPGLPPPPHGNRPPVHHKAYAPPGGRRIVQRVVSPPCYRSVFRREEDDDDALAHWRTARQRLRLPQSSSSTGGGPIDPHFQHPLPPPLSRYRTDFREIGLLGSGNYSKVLRGRHRLDGREYAIKRSLREVSPESVEFSQFLQETQLLANIHPHPHIVQYFSSWIEPQNHHGGGMAAAGGMGLDTTTEVAAGDLLFMQLEKCDVTLGTHSSLIGRVPREPELLDILRQIASALEHLHSSGVVHLDVKPDNIFMLCPSYLMNERNGGGGSAMEGGEEEENKDEWAPPGTLYKLGDFGQAMHLDLIKGGDRKGAGVGVTEGDCRYLPLEVMNSDYSALEKADIFALGATILELAMGKGLPENGQLYQDLRAGKLPLLPTVPASLVKMIKLLMHPNPGSRPTASQVLKSPLLVNCSNGNGGGMKGKQTYTGAAVGATTDENKQSNTVAV